MCVCVCVCVWEGVGWSREAGPGLGEGGTWAGHSSGTHPPVGVVEREGQLLDDAVGVVRSVRGHLGACREARQAQVEVGAHGALDAHRRADVALAEVAVVQRPAREREIHSTVRLRAATSPN